jgi:hypothetical protein
MLINNKDLRKSPASLPKKQTQSAKLRIYCNLCPDKDLRTQTPLYEKRNTNYAKQTQFSELLNKRNSIPRKALRKFSALHPSPKQTQSNPISNLFSHPCRQSLSISQLPATPKNPLCCTKILVFNPSKIYNSVRQFPISIKMEMTI